MKLRRFAIAAVALVTGSLGLMVPAAHASAPGLSSDGTVFCAYADNPWAPEALCLSNPLPNRLPLPW